ncbi:MAG: rhomboid family intramembrane serine protease [Gaiellaceae bacterium]
MLPLKDNVPTRSFPLVTVSLIAANTIVWLWELGRGVDSTVLHDGYYPCSVEGPCVAPASLVHHLPWYESAFSSMFMHVSWAHILGNMLFLWIFGNNVEDALGRVRFFLLYIAAGLVAIVVQSVVTLAFSNAAGASVPNAGASGAIAGVLGAYLVLLPNARVLVFIFFLIREIPAVWFLGIWFLFQFVEGGFALLHPQESGGVAFFAHVGGFLFGALTVRAVAVRRPLQPTW